MVRISRKFIKPYSNYNNGKHESILVKSRFCILLRRWTIIRRKKVYKAAFKNFILILFLAIGISVSSFLVIKQALTNREKNNSIDKGEEVSGKLDKTQLEIKINSTISLENSFSKGQFGMENKSNNLYDIIVKIYLKESNDLIYTSPRLKPGEKIEETKLDKKLDKGTYKAIAYFEAYDEKNYKGRSGAEIEIKVKK